ncbi:MAG: hypothetical protein K0Q67_3214 [Cellvibrio sp.]|nr:hypothetical protein [Cellvibrio sp.]
MELELELELACKELLLDKKMEDKDAEGFDELNGIDDTVALLVADDCALLDTTGAVEPGSDVEAPDEEPSPPPPQAESEIVQSNNIALNKLNDSFIKITREFQ